MFTKVTLVGVILFAALIALVATRKVYFAIAYTILPFLACLALGYGPAEALDLFKNNVTSTMSGILLIIAVAMLFFRTLTATGFFDVIAYHVVKLTKGNALLIYLSTLVLALVGGLSCSVSSVYFLIFGAFTSVYKSLKLDLKKMLFLGGLAMSITGLLPWSSNLLNISVATGADSALATKRSIPLSIMVLISAVAMCVWFYMDDKKNGNLMTDPQQFLSNLKHPKEATDKPMYRLKNFWLNAALFIFVFVMIVIVRKLSSWFVFFLSSFIALAINYPSAKEARKIFDNVGPVFFQLLAVFLPLNLFLGVVVNTGIIANFVDIAFAYVPDFLAKNIHLFLLAVLVPFLRFMPYQILTVLYPFIAGLLASYGFGPEVLAATVVVPMWLATSSSPMVATTHLGVGLAETDLDEYGKFAFKKYWLISEVVLVLSIIFGFLR